MNEFSITRKKKELDNKREQGFKVIVNDQEKSGLMKEKKKIPYPRI